MSSSPLIGRRPHCKPAETLCVPWRSAALRLTELLCLASVVFLAGCGFWLRNNASTNTSPPSSPPPTAGRHGSVTITPQYVALSPGQKFKFTATVVGGGQLEWLVNGVAGGNVIAGTVDSSGTYTAPALIPQSTNVTVTAAVASSAGQNYATAVVAIIQGGLVSCPSATNNPQVALYSLYLPAPGKVYIQFGKTTDYSLNTWQVPTPSPYGGQVQIFVAGMLGNTLYHMRAQAVLNNGATFTDADHTCTTGTPPVTSPIQVSTPGGGTPQPGIEMWNTLVPQNVTQAFATDLNGNVIWTYSYLHSPLDSLQGIQMLPNGHLLILISYLSSLVVKGQNSLINEIREIDLAGNTIRVLNMDTLNKKLAAGNFRDAEGNLYQLGSFHHDVLALPNGHWVVLTTYAKDYTNLPGYPGTTSVIGDALVDVDQNFNPDWVWNSFDHLDINRHPMNFPDWTHSNDMLYSSDDHNLLLSIRHQNWIIKIEFLDGTGSGRVMWRLGEGGDFKLVGGTDPTDWFYAQHGMNYFTPNTTGVFRIGMMDNGNDRIFPTGQVFCKPFTAPSASCYSTMPLLEVNEENMTATLVTHYVPPPSYFSFFGGNAEKEPNNDIHVDFCAPASGAIVQEMDPSATTVVWQGITPKADQFHANRFPSLYPGVQW
ncbi:MAG: aryl-sulfate sulfotransferase [Acidobacteriota bacterium]|nr:aryl-sulfate sulfotransferase [Acidobacteriota bacterium]